MRSFFTIFFFVISLSLIGQTTITFENPNPTAPVNCNDMWSENGIPLQLVPIPPGSTCSFDYSNGDLWLVPARLTVDLSSLSNITSIEIELIDWCGVGCTIANFVENGNIIATETNATSNVSEVMTFTNTNMDAIDQMTIESFENQMFEIRIFTSCPSSADVDIEVEDGDIYLKDACNGIILTSPNGSCYRVKVDDNGGLVTTAITCPQ